VVFLAKRVTVKDIAYEAGVSVTTVAKAINNKTKISDETKRLILDTARRMGYMPNKSARAMASREMKIAVICPMNPPEFISYIEEGFQRGAAELFDFRVGVEFLSYDNPNSTGEIIELLSKLRGSDISGIVFFSGRNPVSYLNQMRYFTDKGVPILFIVTEVENAGEIGTIRLNSEVAGAVASQFLRLTIPEGRPVAILVANKDLKVHSRCVDGFMAAARQTNQTVYGVYETYDDKDIAYHLTQKLSSECPELGGIYVSSYNSVGVCQWMEDHGRQGDIKVIGHDLYPALVEKLINGTLTATLFQNQFEFGRTSLHYMYEYLAGLRKREDCSKLMTPQLVMASNVQCFKDYY
jgi:LacI family transcriptional regulator